MMTEFGHRQGKGVRVLTSGVGYIIPEKPKKLAQHLNPPVNREAFRADMAAQGVLLNPESLK
jgi:hypothetical protein